MNEARGSEASVGVKARAPDPEAAYYQSVEEFFVSRRGDPLFLSNSDWLLVRKWRVAGLPLRVVLRGIADALDSHAHSFSRGKKVGSLAYCTNEVEAAADRWRRALRLDGEEGVGAASCLQRFAEALEHASGLDDDSEEAAFHLSAELRARAATCEDAIGSLEPWLKEREAELLQILRRQLGGEKLAAIERAVESDLSRYASRMPLRVVSQVRADAQTRRILETFGLPRLSLFHL